MRVHQRIWHYLYQRQRTEPLRNRRALATLMLLLSGTAAGAAQMPLASQVSCLHLQPALVQGVAQTCRRWGPAPLEAEAGQHRQRSQHLFPNKEPRPTSAHTQRPRPANTAASTRQPRRQSRPEPAQLPTQLQSGEGASHPSSGPEAVSWPPPQVVATPTVAASQEPSPPQLTGSPGSNKPVTSGNVFPYGQCTWWANQRYFQLHGTYVPWRTQADAWQWVARAYEFHWHVSHDPVPGAIIVLQPGVEGAYALGHVAVVERVLGQGRVLASTMNWGAAPWTVQYVVYSVGPGVAFIYSD